MSYVIKDRKLAAQTRYQVRLFLRKLKNSGVDEGTLVAATAACDYVLTILDGVVENDLPTE